MNLIKLMPKHEIDKREPHKRIKKMYTILMMQLLDICKIKRAFIQQLEIILQFIDLLYYSYCQLLYHILVLQKLYIL